MTNGEWKVRWRVGKCWHPLRGAVLKWDVYQWCRFAQPPANGWEASGLGEMAVSQSVGAPCAPVFPRAASWDNSRSAGRAEGL